MKRLLLFATHYLSAVIGAVIGIAGFYWGWEGLGRLFFAILFLVAFGSLAFILSLKPQDFQ